MKFIKWLFRHKKRSYKVVYIATGFMGNRYDAGIFEFKVSDYELNKYKFKSPEQYGFSKNYKALARHFPTLGNITKYRAERLISIV